MSLRPASSCCLPHKSPSSSQPARGTAMDGTSSSSSLPLMAPYCSERRPKLCTSPLPCGPLSLSVSQAGPLPCFLLPPYGFGVLAQNIQDIPPWGFSLQLPLPRSLPCTRQKIPSQLRGPSLITPSPPMNVFPCFLSLQYSHFCPL